VVPVTGGAGELTAVTGGTAEATAEVTEDTALPAVCATRTGEEGAPRADAEAAPGGGGSCAALAGRAKITVRMRPDTKVAARPPQAYTQARKARAPT
jgi:hypothetical protein